MARPGRKSLMSALRERRKGEADRREPSAYDGRQESGDRRQESGDRRQARGDRRQKRGTRIDERKALREERRIRRREGRRGDRQPRQRRSPEEARQLLLDAAERVFGEWQPDQVGLKDIAREAGTSHALITHYFGTYAGLVEATLERRLRGLRETTIERLRDATVLARPEELIGLLFDSLEDPVHLRLVRWLLASERPAAAHAFGLQANGLQIVARQVATVIEGGQPSRQMTGTIEMAMLVAVSAAYGFALGKYALGGALGRQVTRGLDDEVRSTLTAMVRTYLQAELGAPPPHVSGNGG